MSDTIQKYAEMRAAGVPIVIVTTPDPIDFVHDITESLSDYAKQKRWDDCKKSREIEEISFYGWDAARGLFTYNENAVQNLTAIVPDVRAAQQAAGKPDVILRRILSMPSNGVLFMQMKQEHFCDPIVRQGVANIRDNFKVDGRMLVIIGQQLVVPFELSGDVLYIDEQLPTREMIRSTIEQTIGSQVDVPEAQIQQGVEAMSGLTQFQVEQLTAINLKRTGLRISELWEAKKRVIGQTPGLSMFESDSRFADLVGLENIKSFLTKIFEGVNKPNAIVFIDELEKSINTGTNDTSGVSLDQLQNVLTEMTDTDAMGILLYGIPGVGKSETAKAAANEAEIPCLKLDFGAAKGSLVGQSEGQIRLALKKIRAISSRKTLWIATCNDATSLPAELRSRFSFGSFFFDLPGATQRANLWKLYMAKYELEGKPPVKKDWTGREVRNCCRIAHDLRIDLTAASRYVVPIVESAKDRVQEIRRQAHNCFLDADRQGKYTMATTEPKPTGRQISLDN